MIITLPNKNFYIDFDGDSNFTLKEKKIFVTGKNAGDSYEETIGYFGSLSSAVNRYILRQLGEADDTASLKEFIERYEQLVKEVELALQMGDINL